MKILVINAGSSSIKYAVFENEKEITRGIVDKIGETGGICKTHEDAIKQINSVLERKKIDVDVIGHRVVHGGKISESRIVDKELLNEIEKNSELAPLHNPPQLSAIKACKKIGVVQVAVFDTAFHQTISERAFTYAIPKLLAKKYGIRKYGFHGINHAFIASVAKGKVISCHLGNGCSITAIKDGKSFDTSMGFTPCEGVMMGTRPGDVDVGIIPFLLRKEKYTAEQLDHIINKESGLKGICGSNDMREIMDMGTKESKLAIEMFVYRIAKYIGSYTAAMNGVDCIVFTAGIGENSPLIRKKVCENLTFLGVKLDDAKNSKNEEIISSNDSKVIVKVIKANEELMIAREVKKALAK